MRSRDYGTGRGQRCGALPRLLGPSARPPPGSTEAGAGKPRPALNRGSGVGRAVPGGPPPHPAPSTGPRCNGPQPRIHCPASRHRAGAAAGSAVMAEKVQKSVKIAPGAVVCVESEIRGDVTIGPRTVIHPKARIIAEAGPIVIGEGNLIEEQALILNGYPENITPETEEVEPKPMIIGTNNVFEVGCYSQAMKVGDNNVIESKAFVGRNVILTSGCIIGACCNINTYEVIPENTVIYGADCLRRVQTERPQPQTLQLDFLMKILPNYHHLKKTVKAASTPVKS
ncbi:dynactin subunit 6 [Tyto alba]|uniref:dynactin subunit 6 n=1 Tax=Tyto alba TaxID=56313 RepID=UPI001C669308|nr:dynactin subunit 6 [Tyto alba]XP_042653080.1 dynactin subunit 6 [Tyto alba]